MRLSIIVSAFAAACLLSLGAAATPAHAQDTGGDKNVIGKTGHHGGLAAETKTHHRGGKKGH